MSLKTAIIALSGGLDTSSAALAMKPGHVIGGENYEALTKGGYGRLNGIEATDGRPKPSAAQIVVLGVATAWGAGAVVGASATGSTSAATGVIAYVSGTYLALTKVTGTWVNGENLLVTAVNQGTVILEPSITPLQSNAMYAAAAAIYRSDITEVPGSGPICGHCVIDDVLYAFRNNAGATSQDVYKATTAGWVLIPRKKKIRFNTGTGTYSSGQVTITQGGNQATAYKIMVESGTFAGNAAGTIIMDAPLPGVFTSAVATLSGGFGTVVLESATYAQVTLFTSGRWQFTPYRFSLTGLTTTPVYGVDRVDLLSGRGGNFIEFDGAIIAPLTAGGIDGPYQIECHRNHLFTIHRETSLQHSAIGNPYNWTVISGAGEILIGDPVTGLVSMQGNENEGALFIFCRNRTEILYGTSAADPWNKVLLSNGVGAKPYSAQVVGSLIAYDEQGVRAFSTTQRFGNFTFTTLTDHINRRVSELTPTASAIDRDGGHYRLFFDDGTFLSGIPGKAWSWMFCRYPFTVHVASEWEIAGVSSVFVSSTANDGWVYECDKGRSFNGAAIGAWFQTAYAHLGSPTQRKAFRRIEVEVRGDSAGTLGVQPKYEYGSTDSDEAAAASATNNPVLPPNSAYDLGAWDAGSWDSQYISVLRVVSPGVKTNVGVLVYSNSATELSHEVTALTHYYLPDRRQKR